MMQVDDLEIGDIDDLEDEMDDLQVAPSVYKPQPKTNIITNSKPMDLQTAVELKTLIFGTPLQNFNDEWKLQGFTFCDLPRLKFGIVQKKGGSCGVLASVQACLLQELLFSNKDSKPSTRR